MMSAFLPGEILPTLILDLDAFGKRERFSAGQTGEQPATPAPGAIKLLGNGNPTIIARAVGNDVVVKLLQVNHRNAVIMGFVPVISRHRVVSVPHREQEG
jgi:hypothetical protein